MSDLSAALSDALGVVSDFKSEALQYRTTHAGLLTALPGGWVLHRDRVPQPSFISDRTAEAEIKEGTAKGPLSPTLAIGYEIVDGNSEAWVVESVMTDSQQICRVKRSKTLSLNPDRGHTR